MLAIRTSMVKLGRGLLEGLLDFDSGHRGARVDCGGGHLAEFSEYREKTVDSVLHPVRLRCAYYHCTDCGHGRFPKGEDSGVIGRSLTPGLRRMVARVGSQEPFGQGSRDPEELAGVHLTSKRVERGSEADGAKIRAATKAHSEAVATDKAIPLTTVKSIPVPARSSRRGQLASKLASSTAHVSSGRALRPPSRSQSAGGDSGNRTRDRGFADRPCGV